MSRFSTHTYYLCIKVDSLELNRRGKILKKKIMKKKNCYQWDLNPGPLDLKESVLSIELSQLTQKGVKFHWFESIKATIRPKGQNLCQDPNSSRFDVKTFFSRPHYRGRQQCIGRSHTHTQRKTIFHSFDS